MLAITHQPQLLVKTTGGVSKTAFRAASMEFRLKPLFQSIQQKPGLAATAQPNWFLMSAQSPGDEVNAWDLCHRLLQGGLCFTEAPVVQFAEPDLEQQWVSGTDVQHAMKLAGDCSTPADPDGRLPVGNGFFWFRDDQHSELETARNKVGQTSDRVRIAHFDTGYDPNHSTKPKFLRTDLQKNFVDDGNPNDAVDHSSGLFNNLGHGTGTLGLLAGAEVNGVLLGGAPFLDVVPVRVANSVVLFRNSSIAQAFDYVHSLWATPNCVHVITMSMGGLASQAWAEAVNALYDLGVFIVTAAGNNFGNLPTHNIVYPARFKRVVAACGVMANGSPYADLDLTIMAGNYGPDKKMETAVSAFTPNTPWAKLGCSTIVDHNGRGTSSATPQVAAAAALWLQQNKAKVEKYPQAWMRVEAVRKALFDAAILSSSDLKHRLGRGVLHANGALSKQPADAAVLQQQSEDSASFPFLRVITGLGVAAGVSPEQRMLEIEALQLMQRSKELEQLLPDPEVDPAQIAPGDRAKIIAALVEAPGASDALRKALGGHPGKPAQTTVPGELPVPDSQTLAMAMQPPMPTPVARRLRVFSFDPLLGTHLETVEINQTTLAVHWEKGLEPGPSGEYVEVVDVDSATNCCYAPVDLNHPALLSQDGLPPSEGNPQFHQQMCYAVAMKTIDHFERALGRVALWSPHWSPKSKEKEQYVQRLRIYPHAMREANSFYSPDKKALLLGYFPASGSDPGDNLPGGTVFCSLSHDIIAHETTHALLDGLHRRFREATNPDVLAFHEAFADIVALFQHFTMAEALQHQIALTQGDLAKQNMLGELAQQFGEGIGDFGALRSAIGSTDENGEWHPAKPSPTDYQSNTEPHARGAVLVAAVFDAFLAIYKNRAADLIRLATQGTGVLPPGAIPHDLVDRLAEEASKSAGHVLNICIRALDYCPPVDITFGEYLRALITADLDLVPDDPWRYRVAFIQAFRRRGIYPEKVRSLSAESLCWDGPDCQINLDGILDPESSNGKERLSLAWDLRTDRQGAFGTSRKNALLMHKWLASADVTDDHTQSLGFFRGKNLSRTVNGVKGQLSNFEVHSVRPVRRVGPDGQQRMELVVEITQSWIPNGQNQVPYRGGCTLIIDLDMRRIRYCVRKRVANPDRIGFQQGFQLAGAGYSLRENYFDQTTPGNEPFAMLHRGV